MLRGFQCQCIVNNAFSQLASLSCEYIISLYFNLFFMLFLLYLSVCWCMYFVLLLLFGKLFVSINWCRKKVFETKYLN